jgi:hypothetical protein
MARRIPHNFTDTSEREIASYDYIDFAAGRGYKKFYPTISDMSGATVLTMTSDPVEACNTKRSTTIGTGAETSLTFDMPFYNPAQIEGKCYINYTLGIAASGSTHVKFTLSHVRGAVVTEMGSAYTNTYSAGGGGTEYERHMGIVTLAKTPFVYGDSLRLVCRIRSEAGAITFWHDPGERQTFTEDGSSGTIGSDLLIFIPFILDI